MKALFLKCLMARTYVASLAFFQDISIRMYMHHYNWFGIHKTYHIWSSILEGNSITERLHDICIRTKLY